MAQCVFVEMCDITCDITCDSVTLCHLVNPLLQVAAPGAVCGAAAREILYLTRTGTRAAAAAG